MSTQRRRIADSQENQLTLFDWIKEQDTRRLTQPAPGSFDIGPQLRHVITLSLKQWPFSRHQAAAQMSELLGVEISKSMLDSWTAESKEAHRFPAEFLPAFCQVVGSTEPLRVLTDTAGCYMARSEEAVAIELAQLEMAERQLQERKKQLKAYAKQVWR